MSAGAAVVDSVAAAVDAACVGVDVGLGALLGALLGDLLGDLVGAVGFGELAGVGATYGELPEPLLEPEEDW